MRMELDGSINNLENSNELSEIKLAEIIKDYPNFGKIYTVEEIKKIKQLQQLFSKKEPDSPFLDLE